MPDFPIEVEINAGRASADAGKVGAALGAVERTVESLNNELRVTAAEISTVKANLTRDLRTFGQLSTSRASKEIPATTDAVDELIASVQRAKTGMGAFGSEVSRQEKLLKEIRAPVTDFRGNVRALNALYQEGSITAGEYTRAIDRQRRTFSEAQGGVRGFVAANKLAVASAAAFVGIQVARKVVDLADSYTLLQNRIRASTDSQAEFNKVSDELFRISQATRTDLGGTVEVYSRLSSSLKQLGLDTDAALRFTERLNLVVAQSPSNAQEARAALIQLSQGLGAGALRGEELNSVLEQLPLLADIIARRLGTTRGALKGLAEDGKITSGVVVGALAEMDSELREGFAKSIPTVDQSLTTLKNTMLKEVGEMTRSLGPLALAISEKVSKVIKELKPTLEEIGRTAQGAFESMGESIESTLTVLVPVVNALGEVLGVLNDIKSVGFEIPGAGKVSLGDVGGIATDPVGFVKGGVSKLARGLSEVGDALGINESIGDLESQTAQLKAGTDAIIAERERAFEALRAGFDSAEAKSIELDRRIEQIEEESDKRLDKIAEKRIKAIEGENEARRRAAEQAAARRAREIERENAAFLDLRDAVDPVVAAERELLEAQRLINAVVGRFPALEEEAGRVLALKTQLLRDQIDPYGALLESLERERDLAALSNEERERTTRLLKIENDLRGRGVEISAEQRAQVESLLDETDDLNRVAERRLAQENLREQVLNDIRGPELEQKARLEVIRDLYAEGAITASQYIDAVAELGDQGPLAIDKFVRAFEEAERASHPFREGLRAGLQSIIDDAENAGQTIGNLIARGFDQAADAIIDFIQTGKVSFRDFANSAIRDLNRLILKLIALQILKSAAGPDGSLGGIPLQFAGAGQHGLEYTVRGSGGPDSQLVAVRATPGERLTLTPPGREPASGAPPVVNVQPNFTFVDDPERVYSDMSSPRGDRIVLDALRRNRLRLRGRL